MHCPGIDLFRHYCRVQALPSHSHANHGTKLNTTKNPSVWHENTTGCRWAVSTYKTSMWKFGSMGADQSETRIQRWLLLVVSYSHHTRRYWCRCDTANFARHGSMSQDFSQFSGSMLLPVGTSVRARFDDILCNGIVQDHALYHGRMCIVEILFDCLLLYVYTYKNMQLV